MSITQSLYHTYKRYRTLQTDTIHALPVAILMPHSACNCRCLMCDIWKDNKNLKQLTEADIQSLLVSLKKLGTQQVLLSGGEALLNPRLFDFCRLLKAQGLRISLLSTGLTLKKNADQLLSHVDEVIISLDGEEATHDRIRNVAGAFRLLKEGVLTLKAKNPSFRITARTVIHQQNFEHWSSIIDEAFAMGLDQISFLPADVSSHAFNREVLWSSARQQEVLPAADALGALEQQLEKVIHDYQPLFEQKFIAESPDKLRKIHQYYAAVYGLAPYPFKRCNAPWVSAVVEADGTVRPCFFHEAMGNIHQDSLEQILNNEKNRRFRKELDTNLNSTCARCVCYLHLSPNTNLNG